MDIHLLFPTTKIKTVQPKVITTRMVSLFSAAKIKTLGKDFPAHVLSLCCNLSAEEAKEIAYVDALRILFASWKLTHGSDIYVSKTQCDCGCLNLIKHHIGKEYTSDIYNKIKSISCGGENVAIKLRAPSFATVSSILFGFLDGESNKLVVNGEEVDVGTYLFSECVECSIDKNDLNIIVLREALKDLNADFELLCGMTKETAKCTKCKKCIESTIGFAHAGFLLGE